MSQETRTATIIGNHVNRNVRFETDAETFGELKEAPEAEGLFDGDVRVIVRETRNELPMDKSKLPTGGFTLIVVADKVKSGSESDQYDEMGYHELREECINRGFDSSKYNGPGVTKNVMRAHLRDDDEAKSQQNETVGSGEDVEAQFQEMREKINQIVEKSREEINEVFAEYSDILPATFIPDYSETIDEIKRELGL